MRRTKEWWARLTAQERKELVWMEKYNNTYGRMGGYYPDDCSECTACGNAMLGSGMCPWCRNRCQELVDKANG